MNNDKRPDGFTVNLFEMFWKQICQFAVRVINNGCISIKQLRVYQKIITKNNF